jgi:hypothetical protein
MSCCRQLIEIIEGDIAGCPETRMDTGLYSLLIGHVVACIQLTT